MTLNAFAIELIRAHNDTQDDSEYIDTVEQWIRDALDEYALETEWRAFVLSSPLPTIALQRVYTLPINVRDVRFIRDPNNESPIELMSKERLVDLGLDLEKTGRPDFWYYDDPETNPPDVQYNIGFQPIPDTIYPFEASYDIVPARLLSADTLPIQHDAVLPLRFLVRAYMSFDDENYDKADRFFTRYGSAVDKLLRRENSKHAAFDRLQQRDIPSRGADRRKARLDPNHFG